MLTLQMLSKTFICIRRTGRDIITNVRWASYTAPRYCCQILIKLNFFRQIFEKILKYQISLKSIP